MKSLTLPGRTLAAQKRLSRLGLSWDASDASLTTRQGGAAVFTRACYAPALGSDGLFRSCGANVPRFEPFDSDGDGVFDSTKLVIERSSTNLLLRSQEINSAPWVNTATVTADQALAPDGTLTADLLNDSSAVAVQTSLQDVAVANDASVYTASVWLKKGTSSFAAIAMAFTGGVAFDVGAVINLNTGAVVDGIATFGASPLRFGAIPYPNGWYRLWITKANNATGNGTCEVLVYPAFANALTGAINVASTGTVYAWGAQFEVNAAPTAYMATAAATATRAVPDVLYFPFALPPQSMTIYVKFVEQGTISCFGGRIIALGAAAPWLLCYAVGGFYNIDHAGASSDIAIALAAAPVVGQLVELRLVLNADGSALIGQSINGAAEVTAGPTAAIPFAAAWSVARLYLGSDGTNADTAIAGFVALKATRGVQTMAYMRAQT